METFNVEYTVHSFAFGCDLPFSKKVDGTSAEDAIARFKAGNCVAENVKATPIR